MSGFWGRDASAAAKQLDQLRACQALMERLPIAVAALDERGAVLTGNSLVAAVVGTAPDELSQISLERLEWTAHEPSADEVDPVRRVLLGEAVDEIRSLTGVDGRRRTVRVFGVPAADDSSPPLLLLADITKHMHRERTQVAYSDVYRAVAEHLADVVIVTEAEVIVWVSPSVTLVLGYEPADLIGTRVAGLVLAEDRVDLQVSPDRPTMKARARCLAADGSYRWVDSRVTAQFDQDGSVGQVFHVLRDFHEQKVAEDRATDALLREHAALDASPDGFAIYRAARDAVGRVSGMRLEFLNAAGTARLTGSAVDLIGTSILDFYPQAAANGLWSDMITTLTTGEQRTRRLRDHQDGQVLVTDVVVGRLDEDTVVVTYRDSSEQARQLEALAEAHYDLSHAQHTLRSALDAISDGFVICDAIRDADGEVVDLQVMMANRAAAAMRGTTPEELLGTRVRTRAGESHIRKNWVKAVACLNDQQPRRLREEHGSYGQPGWRVIDVTITPLSRNRLTLAGRDVTEDEHIHRVSDLLLQHAEHRATHDPLTDLANRALLLDRLTTALTECRTGERVAVVYLDLVGFKQINDQHGHLTGDEVLREVARRLQAQTRPFDTAARLGGDEFVLLLRNLSADTALAPLLDRILTDLARPIDTAGGELAIQASTGVYLADPCGQPEDRDADHVLDRADDAMYQTRARQRPAPPAEQGADRHVETPQPLLGASGLEISTSALPNPRHVPPAQLGPTCGPADLARCRALAHHAAPARELTSRPVCRRTRPLDADTVNDLLAQIDTVAEQVRTWSPRTWDLVSREDPDSGEPESARRFARECAHYAGRDGILSYARSVITAITPANIAADTSDTSALSKIHDVLLSALTADLLDPHLAHTLRSRLPGLLDESD